MPLQVNTISESKNNYVNTRQVSKLTQFFTPLVLGTAIALGGQASAQEAKPEESVPQDVKDEPAKNEGNKGNLGDGVVIGYVAGAIMGHVLEKLSQKRKNKELIEELEALREKVRNPKIG